MATWKPARALMPFVALGLCSGFARAEEADWRAFTPVDGWSLHLQTTFIGQGYPSFRSPYEGENSLGGRAQARETWTVTGYAGRRLWEGGEVYFNLETDQGYGLSGTHGVAAFPNGEAQKGGFPLPHPFLHRGFLRQTFNFGGESEAVEDGLNQIAGRRDVSRLTLTLGKFSVGDIFDDNAYAHDPRTTFMNWALWGSGAFDYAADAAGFTIGGAVEFNQKAWAVRAGYFMMPVAPNSSTFDTRIGDRGSAVIELELRHDVFGRPGKVRLLGFHNRSYAASYADALAAGLPIDPDPVRRVQAKYGGALNIEQEVADGIGAFARFSLADGRSENIAFTDIDASAAGGLSFSGARWGRPADGIGLGAAINGLSPVHRDYLAAGGPGILVGDGALSYGEEKIAEVYYMLGLGGRQALTFDYQFIANPGYNRARGPVSVFGLRYHGEW